MQLNPSEISDLIKQKIEQFDLRTEARTEGTIVSLSDGVVRIHGLSDAQYYEMLEFPGKIYGLALNLERDSVGAVVLGDYTGLSEGDWVRCTGRVLEVPVGPQLLGRVVDSLGNPLDGKGPIGATQTSPLEKVAPGVIARKSVDQPVQTGIKAIDAMVPIGRGQRRPLDKALPVAGPVQARRRPEQQPTDQQQGQQATKHESMCHLLTSNA